MQHGSAPAVHRRDVVALVTASSPPALLSLRGVGVRFGGLTALDDVSLAVTAGEVVGVIGPNGAGKTTLFNVACGFVRPDVGQIEIDGAVVRKHQPQHLARHGFARTLQGVGLFGGLSVLENVMVGADRSSAAGFASALLGLPRSDRAERDLRDRSHARLAALGIDAFADRLPGSLPYPVQKRVALARALVAEPRLLLLDEPAGGLGSEDMGALGDLITALPGLGTSVMLVEHHMDLVMSVCHRVVVLDFGRVVASGTPAAVQEDPAVIAAYLGTDVPDAPDASMAVTP
jgi:branched-chain amino acid transport system ATP-binding protein